MFLHIQYSKNGALGGLVVVEAVLVALEVEAGPRCGAASEVQDLRDRDTCCCRRLAVQVRLVLLLAQAVVVPRRLLTLALVAAAPQAAGAALLAGRRETGLAAGCRSARSALGPTARAPMPRRDVGVPG